MIRSAPLLVIFDVLIKLMELFELKHHYGQCGKDDKETWIDPSLNEHYCLLVGYQRGNDGVGDHVGNSQRQPKSSHNRNHQTWNQEQQIDSKR